VHSTVQYEAAWFASRTFKNYEVHQNKFALKAPLGFAPIMHKAVSCISVLHSRLTNAVGTTDYETSSTCFHSKKSSLRSQIIHKAALPDAKEIFMDTAINILPK
jgi:hypothetical protein